MTAPSGAGPSGTGPLGTVVGRRLALWRTFTPLGIRFWDPALDATVDDALSVWAFRADATALGAPGGGVRAFRTPSGVYAFEGLPGLADVEHPAPDAPPVPDAASLASPPFAADFVIAVRDERARYLPMAFTVRLPLPTRGLFLSDAPGGARVPLFSAPTRAVPGGGGLSAVRAELWEVDGPDAPRPAAHAALRVEVDGATWAGLADERGRVLLVFPTPTSTRLSLGSPPGSGGGDVTGQSWPLVVRAAWDPDALRFPLAGARGTAAAFADVPSVKSALDEQPAALLFDADDAAPADALHPELPFARELVLRTRLSDAHAGAHPEEAGRLWLSRGASPP